LWHHQLIGQEAQVSAGSFLRVKQPQAAGCCIAGIGEHSLAILCLALIQLHKGDNIQTTCLQVPSLAADSARNSTPYTNVSDQEWWAKQRQAKG
jgi:hypothetical protein